MTSVWTELKRRNVVRVAIAYAVVAWLVIEISATTFPALRLPEWTITFVTVLLIIGFPFSVVFAWAYELTPEGLKKEKEVVRDESITHLTGRKLDFTIIAVLTVAVGYLIVEKFIWSDDVVSETRVASSSSTAAAADKSIAVLPFVNMSADLDQEYFSDGITEEILNALAGIRELAVTSRTSAFAFKGKNVSIPEIAQELGVAHVLEGSVRKSGTRLRITAQLIDVASDKHLWSETYDRELTDIFAMQDEISANIATALKVNLLGDTVVEPSKRAVNPEAYDMYLHGLQQLSINTYASLTAAEKFFQKAIDIDPSFARAYAGLGWTYRDQVQTGSVRFDVNQPKMRQVLQRGLEIDPENAGLVGLSGLLDFWDGDLDQARIQFSRALILDPPHFRISESHANALAGLGRLEEARQAVTGWFQTDPLNPSANIVMVFSQATYGDFDQALATASRLKAIAPDGPYGDFLAGLIRMWGLGDLATAILDLESGLEIDPNDHEAICMLVFAYFDIGEAGPANSWLEKARQLAPDATFVRAAEAYSQLYRGNFESAREISLDAFADDPQIRRWWGGFVTWRYTVDELLDRGDPLRAVDMILQAEPEWVRFRDQSPEEARQSSDPPSWVGTNIDTRVDHFADFARALRAAGNDSGAENVLAHLEAILNFYRESGVVGWESRVAELHALRGSNNDTLDALERSEQERTIYSGWQYLLIHNRIFDGIRDHPRFVALVDRVKAEMERQRTEFKNASRSSNQIPL